MHGAGSVPAPLQHPEVTLRSHYFFLEAFFLDAFLADFFADFFFFAAIQPPWWVETSRPEVVANGRMRK